MQTTRTQDKPNLIHIMNELQDTTRNLKKWTLPGALSYNFKTRYCTIEEDVNTEEGHKWETETNPNTPLNQYLRKETPNYVQFYTDGSKCKPSDKTGFAVYSPQRFSLKTRISKKYSVYEAEAFAILNALKYIKKSNIQKAVIFSDSLRVLNKLSSIDKLGNDENIIYDIKELYIKIKQNRQVIKFIWIPSHKGIEGNEKADTLAKESTNRPQTDIKTLPYSHTHREYKEEMKNNTWKYVQEQAKHKGTYYFKKFAEKTTTAWFRNSSMKRDNITLINRLKSNHTRVKAHLFKKNIINSPECHCGHPTKT
ncbi:ribonuclease H1-like [Orussus abietinus]|uniref:ribonuclease H1-like n=1 Tax=Orussus abietinus TaxID=222816 RepID=UPI0006260D88|nr:ribonuclease H1-like [Orussus abietinus]